MYFDVGKLCYNRKMKTYRQSKRTLQLELNVMVMYIHDFIGNISKLLVKRNY